MSYTLNSFTHPGVHSPDEQLRQRTRATLAVRRLGDAELAIDLVRALIRAGFAMQTGTAAGGVEIRSCPEYYGPRSVLLSWAPHEAAYAPIDPHTTQVEEVMACALLETVRALGFSAKRLCPSFSIQVQPWSSDGSD
ncbi:hypothetical protein [Streptomyces sp. NPDC003393]